MEIFTDPQQTESPLIREVLAYWRGHCHDGGIPRRDDIDPSDLRAQLPSLMIVDLEQDPFRVRFRLVGTRIVEITGFEFTGKYLDEIARPDVARPFLACYVTASRTRQPVLDRITWRFDDTSTSDYDFCVLPLDDDGEVARRALVAECYASLERQYVFSSGHRGRPGGPRNRI